MSDSLNVELAADRAANAALWEKVRAELEDSPHALVCQKHQCACLEIADNNKVVCPKCACNCFQSRILALLPVSGDLAGAIREVVEEHGKVRHNPLSRDKDDLLGLSCALDRLAAEFGGQAK